MILSEVIDIAYETLIPELQNKLQKDAEDLIIQECADELYKMASHRGFMPR